MSGQARGHRKTRPQSQPRQQSVHANDFANASASPPMFRLVQRKLLLERVDLWMGPFKTVRSSLLTARAGHVHRLARRLDDVGGQRIRGRDDLRDMVAGHLLDLEMLLPRLGDEAG